MATGDLIWVQDLLAWLEKIKGQDAENFAERVKEVLAELPGQGLPEEYWLKAMESDDTAENEIELRIFSDEDRDRIRQDLKTIYETKLEEYELQALAAVTAKTPTSDLGIEYYQAKALAAVAAKIPTSETQLLQEALNSVQRTKINNEKYLTNEKYRSQALAAVAVKIPTSETNLLQRALAATKEIQIEEYQSRTLAVVASKISQPELLKVALHLAQKIKNEYFLSQALTAVALQISDTETKLRQEVLAAAKEIKNEYLLSQVLAALKLLQEALAAAKEIQSEEYRSQALAAVTAQIPDSEPKLLQEALAAAKEIKNEKYRSQALAAVTAQIPDQEALAAAKEIQSEEYRSQALAAVTKQIPDSDPKLLQEALAAAKEIKNEEYRSQALAAVAKQIPLTERQSVLAIALKNSDAIQDEHYRSQALVSVTQYISPSEPKLLKEALFATQKIQDEFLKSQALTAVIIQLPISLLQESHKSLLKEARESSIEIQDSFYKSQVLAAVASKLSLTERQSVLDLALKNAKEVEDSYVRSHALAAVASRLSHTERQSVLDLALKNVKEVKDEYYQSQSLVAVVDQIPDSETQMLKISLETAREIKDGRFQSKALVAVASKLSLTERQAVLKLAQEIANAIQDQYYRSQALAAVAAQHPSYELQPLKESIDAAFKIDDKNYRINALSDIAFHFTELLLLNSPPSQISTILEVATEGKTSADRAKLLSALAPRLSVGLFPRALAIIQEINHPKHQVEALINLAPYLPTEQLTEVLDLVKKHIAGSTYPTIALCNLIPRLSLDQLQQALDIGFERIKHPDLFAQILQILSARLCLLDEAKTQSDNDSAKSKLIQQIKDSLKSKLIQQILDLTLALTNEKSIANILIAIAASLDLSKDWDKIIAFFPPLKSELLESKLPESKLKTEYYRAQVLAAIAPKLSSNQQIDFLLEQVQYLTQAKNQAIAKSAFISFHPEKKDKLIGSDKNFKDIDILKSLQQDLPSSLQHNTDLALIYAIRPYPSSQTELLAKDQTKLLYLIRQQSLDYDKARYLIHLAPHLLPTQALEAQNLAQEISDPYHQAKTLIALSTRFPQVRTEARTKINQIQSKPTDKNENEAKDKYKIQHIELLCEFAIIDPEQISDLLKSIEDWDRPVLSTIEPTNKTPNDEDRERESEGEKSSAKQEPFNPNRKNYKRTLILKALKPHLPIRLSREIESEISIGQAPQDLWERSLFVLRNEYRQALKSGSLRNDAAQNEDLLDIKDEINALTEMLLMRDLTPPVAVGILGGWGGGKSYIMHLMQTHMVEIRSRGLDPIEAWGLAEDKETTLDNSRLNRYVGHIYQIKFDAWTYAKSNLWASLMQTIFFELDRQISLEHQIQSALGSDSLKENNSKIWQSLYEVSDEDRKWFLQNVLSKETFDKWKLSAQSQSDSDLLWGLFSDFQDGSVENLEKLQKELDAQREELQSKRNKIINPQDQNNYLSALATTAIHVVKNRSKSSSKLSTDIQIEAIKTLQKNIANTKTTLSDTTSFIDEIKKDFKNQDPFIIINFKFIWGLISKNPFQIFILFLLLISAIFIVPELIKSDSIAKLEFIAKSESNKLLVQITAYLAPLFSAIPVAQGLIAKGNKLYNEVKGGVSEFKQQLEQGLQRQLDNDPDFRKINRQVEFLEKELESKYAAIPTNIYASIADFVKDRVQKGGYQEHLGMMHQVKEDLTMLSKRLLPPPADSEEYKTKVKQLAKVFPRGPARVVLYIDDLDRCPPDTVVQVLEAVQLLVKNPLFIAVLAIDERYITRALAKHYTGVLPLQGRPSASDYLEKIIQIPYRLRPIAKEALKKYLKAQIIVQDSETSGTKFNEFSPEEFKLLMECCQESELSARSLKRLTNVYKLYKVLSRTRGKKPTQKEQKSILTLLAFSSRYPDLMRDILQKIGYIFEQDSTPKDSEKTLLAVFNKYFEENKNQKNSYLADDMEQLKNDVNKLVSQDLKLTEIKEIFDFVRTFSFVGDIGVEHLNT